MGSSIFSERAPSWTTQCLQLDDLEAGIVTKAVAKAKMESAAHFKIPKVSKASPMPSPAGTLMAEERAHSAVHDRLAKKQQEAAKKASSSPTQRENFSPREGDKHYSQESGQWMSLFSIPACSYRWEELRELVVPEL